MSEGQGQPLLPKLDTLTKPSAVTLSSASTCHMIRATGNIRRTFLRSPPLQYMYYWFVGFIFNNFNTQTFWIGVLCELKHLNNRTSAFFDHSLKLRFLQYYNVNFNDSVATFRKEFCDPPWVGFTLRGMGIPGSTLQPKLERSENSFYLLFTHTFSLILTVWPFGTVQN